ncbi:hypothetical protein VHEMI08082 [[Torrubiella] hemipterigena]|uniref:Uncharacterized protein n=1 Tax=[Torrubiella] hemipterigena TaxID=1531966 RepID=A0A0A1TMT4_9HYPO|nr:hypothetical protein VHEMI08082 [[Torrubiella] hemipterigena]
MSLTAAVQDLFKSAYEFIASIFHTIFAAFASLVHLFESVVLKIVAVVGSIGTFVLGNFIVLSIGAGLMFFYLQRSGKKPAAALKAKKTN